jgi:solute carrier family 25 carnitine/acylcarnitine transporter 20/29
MLIFQGYDVGKTLVNKYSTIPETGMTLKQYAAAGFFSAIPMTAITAPFERIKIVLQIQGQQQGSQKQYSGGLDALRGIYKEGGFRSGKSSFNVC